MKPPGEYGYMLLAVLRRMHAQGKTAKEIRAYLREWKKRSEARRSPLKPMGDEVK